MQEQVNFLLRRYLEKGLRPIMILLDGDTYNTLIEELQPEQMEADSYLYKDIDGTVLSIQITLCHKYSEIKTHIEIR